MKAAACMGWSHEDYHIYCGKPARKMCAMAWAGQLAPRDALAAPMVRARSHSHVGLAAQSQLYTQHSYLPR